MARRRRAWGRCWPHPTGQTGPRGRRPAGLSCLACDVRPPGAVDLDNFDPRLGERGADPQAVAAGALDTDGLQGPILVEPHDGLLVPGGRGGELLIGDFTAVRSDDGHMNSVQMRIDAANAEVLA